MGMLVEFTADGAPVPQPRADLHAVQVRPGKWAARAYRDKNHPITAFRQHVALQARAARPAGWPLDAAYHLAALFVLPRTQALGKGVKEGDRNPICSTLPDTDNYLKGAKDALKGILWSDDGRVWCETAMKCYARPGQVPHARVLVLADSRNGTVGLDDYLAAWLKLFRQPTE